jgi:hypothetical protein
MGSLGPPSLKLLRPIGPKCRCRGPGPRANLKCQHLPRARRARGLPVLSSTGHGPGPVGDFKLTRNLRLAVNLGVGRSVSYAACPPEGCHWQCRRPRAWLRGYSSPSHSGLRRSSLTGRLPTRAAVAAAAARRSLGGALQCRRRHGVQPQSSDASLSGAECHSVRHGGWARCGARSGAPPLNLSVVWRRIVSASAYSVGFASSQRRDAPLPVLLLVTSTRLRVITAPGTCRPPIRFASASDSALPMPPKAPPLIVLESRSFNALLPRGESAWSHAGDRRRASPSRVRIAPVGDSLIAVWHSHRFLVGTSIMSLAPALLQSLLSRSSAPKWLTNRSS